MLIKAKVGRNLNNTPLSKQNGDLLKNVETWNTKLYKQKE
jgi:hypothetical protein